MKESKLFSLAVVAGILLLCSGCDRATDFLSEYFPSLKKEEQAVAPAPAQKPVDAVVVEQPLPANVLARVGKWTLTKEDFEQRLAGLKEVIPEYDIDDLESKQLILEELVRQQMLVQDAEQSGMANDKEIKAAVEEFRNTILVREMAAKITEGVIATAQEAQEYYEENKEAFVEPEEYRIREIVVPTQEEARDILVEILKGTDFAEMAQARSQSESASGGGDLGFLVRPKFPEMAGQMTVLDAGEVSSVFRGPDGYYIIKMEEKTGGAPVSFEEVREDIVEGLTLLKQQQAILEYIDNIKKKIDVQVNEKLLER